MMRLVALMMGVILAGGATAVAAQERQFGVKVGVNAAALSFAGDPEGGYEGRRIGMTGGGFAVLPLSGPLAVQLEALFGQKGAELTLEEEDLTATLELDYLDFPVLARFSGPASGAARFHVLAGPSLSYRMGANSRVAFTGFDFAQGEVDNIEDDVRRFDVGLVVGAGADIGRRLVVDARYVWGLTNVFKDTPDGGEIKHRVLSVMAGIRF